MLQTKTVEPGTLPILKQLMKLPSLKQSSLVGVTALALLYGHRITVDLDLFINREFHREVIIGELKTTFGRDFELEDER